MTILLLNAYTRNERRLRLTFSNVLDSGYDDIAHYTVVNLDGKGTAPLVVEVFLITPTTVELALDKDLASNALYTVFAEDVPAADASDTDTGTQVKFSFRVNEAAVRTNVERAVSRRELLLYFADLIWDTIDFVETATGDLARITGVENVSKALLRGATSEKLPYDSSWGAHARESVDSPSPSAGNLNGALIAQGLKDPRVKSISVTFELGDDSSTFHLNPKLFSGELITPVSVVVPGA